MADNEIDEFRQRATRTLYTMIAAGGQFAQVLIEARIAQLRRTAQRDDDEARRIRAATRVHQQADAAIWRPAARPRWWQAASAEDISRVWQAASTWRHVDPGAAAVHQVVAEHLAKRGVRVDPPSAGEPAGVEWLSDALDQAAVNDPTTGPTPGGRHQADAAAVDDVQARQERMATEVRAAWPEELADKVLGCSAWGALAYKLDQLQRDGHDPQQLLRGVPEFVWRARSPAAFAFRAVDDIATGKVDLGMVRSDSTAVGRGDPRPASPTAAPDPEPPRDEQIARAARIVVMQQRGSTTLVGRSLGVRFAQAQRLLAELEDRGIVGPARPGRPRDVLVTADELPARLPGHTAAVVAEAYPTSTRAAVADASTATPDAVSPVASAPRTRPSTAVIDEPGR